MTEIQIAFGEEIHSHDPDEREAALVHALLQVAAKASWGFGLSPCPVYASLAYAAVSQMAEHGHLSCAAEVADEIATTVATLQRVHGRPTDA